MEESACYPWLRDRRIGDFEPFPLLRTFASGRRGEYGPAAGDGEGLRRAADEQTRSAFCADYGERSEEQINRRNGYLERT
jgi:hypothetical protein